MYMLFRKHKITMIEILNIITKDENEPIEKYKTSQDGNNRNVALQQGLILQLSAIAKMQQQL